MSFGTSMFQYIAFQKCLHSKVRDESVISLHKSVVFLL